MKNTIEYYYNLIIHDFKKSNETFTFEINKKTYSFVPFYGNFDLIFDCYNELNQKNKYCHEILFNKYKSAITQYNGRQYILIKKNLVINKKIDLKEIINYDIPVNSRNYYSLKTLLKEKIDYYEYQMSQLSFKFPILKKSFNYYVGLTETSISLLNYVSDRKINLYVCHKRIKYKEKVEELFNPLEFVVDNRTRDIAEYIKINYLNEDISINKIYQSIDYLNFNYDETILFLSRLIYPSYYFDLYDQIIQGNIREDKILLYIYENVKYEEFLKKIYLHLNKKNSLPNIDWLNNQ